MKNVRAKSRRTWRDETADNIARGMPPAEAAAAARRKFGNPAIGARGDLQHEYDRLDREYLAEICVTARARCA